MDKQKYWFFGSKLNTVLLLILIILMVIALKWMAQDKEKYLPRVPAIHKEEPQIEGDKDNLVSFSIKPNQEVFGIVKAIGVIKGGYFFEGNLPISILDSNKNLTKYGPGHGQATTDWMTAGPVSFEASFDFTKMPKGTFYIKIMQDDPSGGESGNLIKFVLIPIVIK